MLEIFQSLNQFNKRSIVDDLEGKRKAVLEILSDVKEHGDKAILSLTERFDKVTLQTFKIPKNQIKVSREEADPLFLAALEEAAKNIKEFHTKQRKESWFSTNQSGSILGQKLTPMNRIGIYVPGGTAAYPSSVLMNAIPAMVAGVNEIVMVTPPNRDGNINKNILIAADIVGIEEIYTVGGAQAIAALAYGTESIRPVDKIVGPGNIYVALAKKEVFGIVGIDMIAGPSEIAIIADEHANPNYIAADLLSQAEHDSMSSSILITTSLELAKKVQISIKNQLEVLPRKNIAMKAIADYSGIIVVDSLEKGFDVINQLAPEHLEVLIRNPFDWLGKIKHAGAIFLGEYSSEPLGDYFAGPNHVLPTNGTARFSSPLNVDDFMTKSSVIYYSKEDFKQNGQKIIELAKKEGLEGHANAIRVRLEDVY